MVQSFARFWAKQTVSTQQLRRLNFHEVNEIEDYDLYAAPEEAAAELEAQPVPNVVAEPPNASERERWKAKLMHFHKSSQDTAPRET